MSFELAVLIVEDEPLIAMMLEDFVEALGHRVAGCLDNVPDALASVEGSTAVDLVILDVHLRGNEDCWPVADALADRGIPFVLATGGHTRPPPERHIQAPTLAKPFTMDNVREAVQFCVQRSDSPS